MLRVVWHLNKTPIGQRFLTQLRYKYTNKQKVKVVKK